MSIASQVTSRLLLLSALVVATLTSPAFAEVTARVGDAAIDSAQVDALLRESFGQREITANAFPALEAQALEQLIDRQLVLAYLAEQEAVVNTTQVEGAIARFKEQLALRKLSFEEFLKQEKLTEDLLRGKILWQLSWGAHTARQLNEQRLKTFFDEHRRELDGTQVRVSHLLLKLPDEATKPEVEMLHRRAEQLLQQISAGETSFADAVQQHSSGSKKDGGDLGFIQRHGAMPEPFSRAAFQLKENQISRPVQTRFGVHLILCTKIKPGEKEFKDVLDQVRRQAAIELFQQIAQQQRPKVQVQYTGATPYIDPKSGNLVTGRAP